MVKNGYKGGREMLKNERGGEERKERERMSERQAGREGDRNGEERWCVGER